MIRNICIQFRGSRIERGILLAEVFFPLHFDKDKFANVLVFVSRNEYEGGLSISLSALISLQPLGVGNATIPHVKAIDVPFHLIYGSLICAKRFQSDRQNKEGCSQTPGGHQYMIIKYLSVGQWT